jgi:gamma-glutamylcyclotransferase
MAASGPNVVALYFGYGSNLWLEQMALRCPQSTFVGIAKLQNYRWMINERGYANIVEHDSSSASKSKIWHVWGMVYALTSSDVKRLDKNEGVPYAYTKEILDIDFWSSNAEDPTSSIEVNAVPEKRDMLVYIDRKRTVDDEPKDEYIYRMNKGITDALKVGIPSSYVENVMRKFIPPMNDTVDGDVLVQAQKQAVEFVDERSDKLDLK